jgi:putative transcriptional regulator
VTAEFRLREELARSGLSQSELARRSGVSFATVNRLCTNATTRVDLSTLDRLAEVLGCEPGDLIVQAGSRKGRKRGRR